MARRVHLSTVLVFLIALASNCVQASHIDLDDPSSSPVTALNGSASTKTDDCQFLVTNENDSDETPKVISCWNEIPVTEPAPYSLVFPTALIAVVHAEQLTVLRL
jgi:hypothetical protein